MSSKVTSASTGRAMHSFDLMRPASMGTTGSTHVTNRNVIHGEGLVDISASNVSESVSLSLAVSEQFGVALPFNPTKSSTTDTRGNDELSEFSSAETDRNSNDHIIYQTLESSQHHLHQDFHAHTQATHKQLNSNNTSIRQPPELERRSQRLFERENTTGDNSSKSLKTRQATAPAERERGVIIFNQESMQQGDYNQSSFEQTTTPNSSNLYQLDGTQYTANYLRRSAMGHSIHREHSNPWRVQGASSSKMERTAEETPAERKDRDDDSYSAASTASVTLASPAMNPIQGTESSAGGADQTSAARLPVSSFGTPSTISTVGSIDDASMDGLVDSFTFERLSLKMDDPFTSNGGTGMIAPRTTLPPRSGMAQQHRRSTSWEGGRGLHQGSPSQLNQRPPNSALGPSPQQGSREGDIWNSPGQARVATFRPDSQVPDQHGQYGYAQVPHTDAWRQQRRFADRQMYQMSQQMANQLPPSGQHHHSRKGSNGPPTTPPRNRQNRPNQSRPAASLSANGGPSNSTNPPRSPSEVLKTLLRKKACLYEPDTSKAVALVTWLVGRELALHHGYFSRQQLQSGVHACVAEKIDSGAITRTKVNRCMQIILNSCFHYIIPRPDGSEESGDSFRRQFEGTSQDEHGLLSNLHAPWNNVVVKSDVVLHASTLDHEEGEKKKNSPHQSPQISGAQGPPSDHRGDGGEGQVKRAVLLCFNENVRSAEDVFRCHNEFIRDTANASKLQLSANEWRSFFGRSGPHQAEKDGQGEDYLGHMTESELNMFRTSWCAKRYDHDHELCGFAHLEANGGWLRRALSVHMHNTEICPDIISVGDEQTGKTSFRINQCRNGVYCHMAHSQEEIMFHPSEYKKHVCHTSGHCSLGDICHNYHPQDSSSNTRRPSNDYRPSHQRHFNRQHHHGHDNGSAGYHDRGTSGVPLPGAPMLYVSPAPFSSFEKHLHMPGLQNLFRRRSSVLRACQQRPKETSLYFSFGDDCGIAGAALQVYTTGIANPIGEQ